MRPRIVDHYELHEELGHGGMATVYRATDLRLDRTVALKILHDHIAAQPDNRERFVREAKAAARLKHPNILQIYGFSSPDDSIGYLAAELIDGPTLRTLDARDLRAYPELAAALVLIIARALRHAHEHGIVHRDIKPENIMVDRRGRPRLMDFGLARLLDAHTMTATGSLMGSPAHMAPEIVEGHPYDERVDVFALGTVLYFLCTGRLPFEATNPATLLHKILTGDYTPARNHNQAVSNRLNAIIDHMLARNPEDRLRDAAAVEDALHTFLTDLGVTNADETIATWWTDAPAFLDAWVPALTHTVEAHALRASKQGRAAIPDALDWTNRLLLLDPDNETGQRLLVDIATHRAAWPTRIRLAITVVVTLLVAASIALLVQSRRDAASTPHTSFVTKSWQASRKEAELQHNQALARAWADHVRLRTLTVHDDMRTSGRASATVVARQSLHEGLALAADTARGSASDAPRPSRPPTSTRPTPGTRPTTPPRGTTNPSRTETDGPNAATGVLLVNILVQPPAAEVFVDGEKRCASGTRCVVELTPGTYDVVARHPVTGMEVRERARIRYSGTELRMRVPWRPGTLIVESNKSGIVLFNGVRVGRTDSPIEIPIEGIRSTLDGTLRVIPDGDFGQPIERRVTVSSGEVRREPIRFQ